MKWVRTEAFLSILIIALAFASGALVLSIKNGPSLGMTAPILQQEVQKFKKSTPSLDHFRTDSFLEFIDPQNILPSYFKFEYREVQDLLKFSDSCESIKSKKSAALLKSWQWVEYKCGHRKINQDFFSKPPFFHPIGHSFAYLAKKDSAWVKAHINLFHVSELRDLQLSDLPSPYRYLTSLEINSMSGLSAGDAIVITDQFVFADSGDDTGYAVYPRAKWDIYWAACSVSHTWTG